MRSFGAVAVVCALGSGLFATHDASAHSITVDGVATDWSSRVTNADDLGIVVRDASQHGEFVWQDNVGDARTDLMTPETQADISRVQLTATGTGLGILVRFASMAATSPPVQVQIALDFDHMAGSGQTQLPGFADTVVAAVSAWEYVVQTQSTTGVLTAQVLDATFASVGAASAAAGTDGVEIFVPWTLLGRSTPPSSPIAFTVASFRETAAGNTVDIGGPTVSNALDVMTDYGDPRATGYLNTFSEVSDQSIDYQPLEYFDANGEVYAPLLITRFVADAAAGIGNEWVALRNDTPATLSLAGYKVGDEETPDGTEGMYTFPAGASVAAGGTYIVALSGANYTAYYGHSADAEFTSTDTTPDMAHFALWASGTWGLANGGDEILVLGAANTLYDVVTYGTGVYPGVVNHAVIATTGHVYARVTGLPDRDDNSVDFGDGGAACISNASCGGGACTACSVNTCGPLASGTSCSDGNACNGAETCSGTGTCQAGTPLTCDDSNPCTADACDSVLGCTFTPLAMGASCSDGNACNGTELCDGLGTCGAGTPLTCDDGNACTSNTCDGVAGCVFPPVAPGSPCPDGNACNGDETCDGAGTCTSGTPPSCNDANACTADSCDMVLGCLHAPLGPGASCSDGNACNGAEICDGAGMCTSGTPLSCIDGNPCTADACNPLSGCSNTPTSPGSACPDGNACNGDETCDGAGACLPGVAPSCDDANACTTDACDMVAGCTHAPVSAGTACSDGNACNGLETCNATGMCQSGSPVTCAPSTVACRVNACDMASGSCALSNAPAGTSCDDGDPCDGVELCDALGGCQPGTPPDGGCSDAGDAMADAEDASDGTEDVAEASDASDDVMDASDAVDDVADATDDVVAVTDATDDVVDATADAASEDAADVVAMDVVDASARDASVDVATDAPSPPTDAHTDGAIDARGDASGDGSDGGTLTASGGCNCRAAGTPAKGAPSMAWLSLAVIALCVRRRRRGSRR